MRGYFFIAKEDSNAELRFLIIMMNQQKASDTQFKTSGEVFPTVTMPVVANSRSMERAVFPMH